MDYLGAGGVGGRAVSTAAAAIAALFAVLLVAVLSTLTLHERASILSGAASERMRQGEELIRVRLSTAYHVPPILVVSNDGTTPVRITRIYIDGLERPIDITLAPGEKRGLTVGNARHVAVMVEGYGVVVLQTVRMPTP